MLFFEVAIILAPQIERPTPIGFNRVLYTTGLIGMIIFGIIALGCHDDAMKLALMTPPASLLIGGMHGIAFPKSLTNL
jgi:hypothetical protein